MKILLLMGLLASCGKNNVAQATFTNHVKLTPTCSHSRAFGECQLKNTSPFVVTCSFNIVSNTMMGNSLQDTVFVVLYPNAASSYYVQAYNPRHDPLIHLSSTAYCYLKEI